MRRIINGLLVTLFVVATGCGGRDVDVTEEDVLALNFETGDIKSFPKGKVPPGWGICPTPECKLPPIIPCQNVSPKVCSLLPHCRLKELGCTGSSCAQPAPPAPPVPCPPQPPKCEYACVPKLPLSCEELATDEKACTARTDCEWGEGICALGCPSPGPCPPCPKTCRTKGPATCEQLDQLSCAKRGDCEWTPEVCACPVCAPGSKCPPCECKAFCRPRQLPCPKVLIPQPDPSTCPGGKWVPKYDQNKCVIGWECQKECPQLMPPPPCPNGKIVPKYDPLTKCVIGYECIPTTPTECEDLGASYVKLIQQAKTCSPMLTVEQCTKLVPNQLACSCPTSVNASSAVLQKLADLQATWDAKGCGKNILCPAVACFVPLGGSCSPQGSCVDKVK